VSAEDEIRLKDAPARLPTKAGVKHTSGEMNGSGSNGHAGPHENLPPRPDEKQGLVLDVLPAVSADAIVETLEVAAKTVSVVGEFEIGSITSDDDALVADDDALVDQDAAVRTVVFWVRQTDLIQCASFAVYHWVICTAQGAFFPLSVGLGAIFLIHSNSPCFSSVMIIRSNAIS